MTFDDSHASTAAPETPALEPLVVDMNGLADMLQLSYKTVRIRAARRGWLTGELPPPTYVGRAVTTQAGRGARWRISTVHAWIEAVGGRW